MTWRKYNYRTRIQYVLFRILEINIKREKLGKNMYQQTGQKKLKFVGTFFILLII